MKSTKKAIALSLVLGCLGLAIYFALARTLFSLDLGSLVDVFSSIDIALIALAIGMRSLTPLLEALQLHLCLRALRLSLRFRDVFRGMSASLATEYVIPIGGLVEVYKAFFLVRQSIPISEASQIVFLHRSVISLSMLMELTVILLAIALPLSLSIPLILVVLGLVAVNILVYTAFRLRKFVEWVNRTVNKLYRKLVSTDLSSVLMAFRANPVSLLPLVGALITAIAERISIGLSGYLTVKAMGIDIGFLEALLVFDLIQTIIWIVPIVTPGGLGFLESIQLLVFKGVGLTGVAISASPLLFRIVTMVALLPQLLPVFFADVLGFLKGSSILSFGMPSARALQGSEA